MKKIMLFLLLCVTACNTVPTEKPASTPTVVKVYATAATQAWQTNLFDCATKQSVALALTDPGSADISLRMGEPQDLSMPAFQLGWEEIVVVVNKSHSFSQLQTEQVAELFTGGISDWSQITPPIFGTQNEGTQEGPGAVQVWVFAAGEDAQQVFAKTLAGKPVVSSARLATSPEEMSRAIANDPHAVGILPRRWKTGNISDVYVAASAPVLAITPSKPQGVVKDLLACLQG
jgi:ABC-type phosphate transport system substrate-binding protein